MGGGIVVSSFGCRVLGYSDLQVLQTLVRDASNIVDLTCMAELTRGTIVNITYGTHKNLYVYLFLLTIFGLIYCDSPQ